MFPSPPGVLGPEFCALDSDEVEFCDGDQTDDEDRSCDDDEVCTSTCQCWDGTAMRATDTDEFIGLSIDDQGVYVCVHVCVRVCQVLTHPCTATYTHFLSSYG